MHKYEGDEKFNPKSFKSGSSVGYIDRSAVTDEVLFAQIRMLRELMFNVVPLSRYNHLVGNGGSNVWVKWTAQTAIPWKTNMVCPMSLPGMPGCCCPILKWTSKEMFIEHWQIYHIDQHTSRIICEHKKDGVSCHYLTDCEMDMKAHMHKLHEPAISEKLATNRYVKENAWLDLTSSWSIKDLEMNYKTFPEARSASSLELFVWVIMDTAAEDPRTKANAFRVPPYNSKNWQIMIDLGVFTIKDMIKAIAGEEESIPPKTTKAKKGRNRKQRRAQAKAIMESDSTDSADDKPTNSIGGEGVKSSSKLKPQSTKMGTEVYRNQ